MTDLERLAEILYERGPLRITAEGRRLPWAELPQSMSVKADCRRLARELVAALLPPSEAMVEAGAKAVLPRMLATAWEDAHAVERDDALHAAENAWDSMLGAVLKDEGK